MLLATTKVETFVDDADEQTILNSLPSLKDLFHPSEPRPGPSRGAPQPENSLKRANRGDLDWSYTYRCVRRWSPNSLLTHLYSHAFSVPPRDTKLSFPFVNINVFSQDDEDPETVSVPQTYRLPLLMVAKYLWETVHLALSAGREEWLTQTTNIFHISRLCENLFAGARVKTAKGGMEVGWRCVMFDRFLTRFYKHWTQNDPASNEAFCKEHEEKEYDKDVLKHDWKRWSLRGLNGIRLTEQEVSWGLSADQFRKTLILNRDSFTWTLEGKTLSFITSDEGPAWSSVSELTDMDFGEDDEEVKPSLDVLGSILPASTTPKEPLAPFGAGPSAKRLRFSHRSSADRLSPRKVPDQARLSTLRKSARTPSALASLSSVATPNSTIHHQTTLLPETTSSLSISSSNPVHTPIHPSRSKESLVVLIKRRPPVKQQTESLEQSSVLSTHAERSSAPSVIDLTQPSSPSNLSKRRSRPSPRKKAMESEATRKAKRRRIDELDKGKEQEVTPIQAFPTSASNGVPYTQQQRTGSLHVDVSVQTTPTTPIVIEQGAQTDISIGSEMHVDGDVVICDSTTRMPAATIATRTTADIAIQAELIPVGDDNSLEMGNGIMEGCTTKMQKDLSIVVGNLVSSRLVSLMRDLKQSSESAPTSGSGTDSSSPTLYESSALVLTNRGASGTDRNLVNGLFDEVRLLREEAHSREQRTREEMRALRQLHNAEVDSLRRRLAYLESQSHEQQQQQQPVKDCDTRRAAGEPSYSRGDQTHYNSGKRAVMPPRLVDKQYHFPEDEMPGSSFNASGSLRSPDPPVPGPFSNGNGISGRLFSTNRSRNDLEEDSPLPSKTQRKSHIIAFSRPAAIG